MNTDDANNPTTTAPRAEEITQRREDTKTRRPWAVLSATTTHFMAPAHSMLADRKTKPLPKQKAIARLTAFHGQPITACPHTFGGTKSLRRPTEGFYDTAVAMPFKFDQREILPPDGGWNKQQRCAAGLA